MLEDFYNDFGLLNAHPDELFAENSLLFSYVYLKMMEETNDPTRIRLASNLYSMITMRLDRGDGYFDQKPFRSNSETDYMSHDQLTTIMLFLKEVGEDAKVEEIWNRFKSNLFTYDNVNRRINFNRLYHPRDIIFYGMIAGTKLWYLLYPLWFLMVVWTMFNKETSGKQLNWVRCKGLNLTITFKILTMLNRFNWKKTFEIYYPYEDHPIHEIVQNLYEVS